MADRETPPSTSLGESLWYYFNRSNPTVCHP